MKDIEDAVERAARRLDDLTDVKDTSEIASAIHHLARSVEELAVKIKRASNGAYAERIKNLEAALSAASRQKGQTKSKT